MAGCSAIPVGGSTPSFTDWFHVRDPEAYRWFASYFDNAQFHSKASSLNDSDYARLHGWVQQNWLEMGISPADVDWEGSFSPSRGVSVDITAGQFDRGEVSDHIEWRDGTAEGSHDGFDLYDIEDEGEPDRSIGLYFGQADAYAVGDRLVLGVSTAEDAGSAVDAARQVIDDRGTAAEGVAAEIVDRLSFSLLAGMQRYQLDYKWARHAPLPGSDFGAYSVAVTGEETSSVTMVYAYHDESAPPRGDVTSWVRGQEADRDWLFDEDADPSVTVDNDVVEISGTVTGTVFGP